MPVQPPLGKNVQEEAIGCGTRPRSYPQLPSAAIESALPDDLLLARQGVTFESSNPLPISDEGSLDTTQDNQYRLVRTRRVTPRGVVERLQVAVDVGSHVHAVITKEPVPVVLNPPSESNLEVLPDESSLPTPEIVNEPVVSDSDSGGISQSDYLKAQFASRGTGGSISSTGGRGFGSGSTSRRGRASYSQPTTTYSTPTSSYSGSVSSAGSSSVYIPPPPEQLGVNIFGQTQPTYIPPSDPQDVLEQLEVLHQGSFGYYGPGY